MDDTFVEKPYAFVPFPNRTPQRQNVSGHHHFDQDRLSGQLLVALVAKSPVQVGSGAFDVLKTKSGEEVVADSVYIKVGNKKIRVLPGSSVKGVLRTVVEALSPSCVRVASGRTNRALRDDLQACRRPDQLCPACRLFGMTGRGRENYLGQLQVEDAHLEQGKLVFARTPLLWLPARSGRNLPGRYLADDSTALGYKFYYHGTVASGPDVRLAIGQGAIFAVRMSFANLAPAELGLVMAALGQHPEHAFWLKIGGGKPVGLGSVAPHVIYLDLFGNIRQTGRAGRGVRRLEDDKLTQQINEWLAVAEKNNLLNRVSLKALWDIWQPAHLSRTSPAGAY